MLKTLSLIVAWSVLIAWLTLGWVTPPKSGYDYLATAPFLLGSFFASGVFLMCVGVVDTIFKVKTLYKDNYFLAGGLAFVLTLLMYVIYV